MARKTLEEKKLSDNRLLYHFEKVVSPTLVTVQSNTHSVVAEDLIKTLITTAFIFSVQLILFLALKNHLFRIPGISY